MSGLVVSCFTLWLWGGYLSVSTRIRLLLSAEPLLKRETSIKVSVLLNTRHLPLRILSAKCLQLTNRNAYRLVKSLSTNGLSRLIKNLKFQMKKLNKLFTTWDSSASLQILRSLYYFIFLTTWLTMRKERDLGRCLKIWMPMLKEPWGNNNCSKWKSEISN